MVQAPSLDAQAPRPAFVAGRTAAGVDPSAAVGATNPVYTISNAYLAAHTPVAGAVGELATTSLTFTGGTIVKTVA